MNRTKRHVQQHMQLLQPVCDCEQNKKTCSTARNTCNQCMTMNRPKRHVQQNACSQWMTMTINRTKRHVQLTRMVPASVRLWTEQRDLYNTCSQWTATNRTKRLVQHLQPVYDYEQNKETCSTLAASIWLWTKQINPHFSCLPLKRFWRGRKTMAAIWVSARWGFWTVSSWAAWPLPALPGQQPSPTSRPCPCLCPCPCCPWGYLMGKCWCSWCPWLGELLLQWKAWSEAVNMGAAWWWWRRHPKPSCPRAFAHRRVLSPPPLPLFSHWQCQRCSGWRRAWATFVLSGLP